MTHPGHGARAAAGACAAAAAAPPSEDIAPLSPQTDAARAARHEHAGMLTNDALQYRHDPAATEPRPRDGARPVPLAAVRRPDARHGLPAPSPIAPAPALTPSKPLPAVRAIPRPAGEPAPADRGAAIARQHRALRSLARTTRVADLVWLTSDAPAWFELERLPRDDAYALQIDFQPDGWRKLFDGDRCTWNGPTQAHAIQLTDLAEPQRASVRGRVDALVVRVSRRALDEVADGAAIARPAALRCEPGTVDHVLGALGRALVCAMREPGVANAALLEQLASALVVRALSTCAEAAVAPRAARATPGGLAPWQERRAKQWFADNLASDASLADVARECRLSRGHFSKAFKQSTGESPHAWFTRQRIAAAQSLMRGSQQSLAEIALACGFGDQSHLTRVFQKCVGSSPGQWRRRVAD